MCSYLDLFIVASQGFDAFIMSPALQSLNIGIAICGVVICNLCHCHRYPSSTISAKSVHKKELNLNKTFYKTSSCAPDIFYDINLWNSQSQTDFQCGTHF